MKKLVVIASLLSVVVVSDCFARAAAWGNNENKSEIFQPEPPVVETVDPVEPTVPTDSKPETPSISTAQQAHHHKSWWKKHDDEIIIGTITAAVFVGVMVYAFGFEHSSNDPAKVKLAEF